MTDGTFTFSSPEAEEQFKSRNVDSITSLSEYGNLFIDLRNCENDIYYKVERIKFSINCGRRVTFERVIPCEKCQYYDFQDQICIHWNAHKEEYDFCSYPLGGH